MNEAEANAEHIDPALADAMTDLATNPLFSSRDLRAVPAKYHEIIPEYVKDYVSLNQFAV